MKSSFFNYSIKGKMRTVITRMQKPTPKFFKEVRNAGLALGTVGLAITNAPVAMPILLLKIGSYLIVGGAVAGAVSQSAVKYDR